MDEVDMMVKLLEKAASEKMHLVVANGAEGLDKDNQPVAEIKALCSCGWHEHVIGTDEQDVTTRVQPLIEAHLVQAEQKGEKVMNADSFQPVPQAVTDSQARDSMGRRIGPNVREVYEPGGYL